jgi:hypothetical protein
MAAPFHFKRICDRFIIARWAMSSSPSLQSRAVMGFDQLVDCDDCECAEVFDFLGFYQDCAAGSASSNPGCFEAIFGGSAFVGSGNPHRFSFCIFAKPPSWLVGTLALCNNFARDCGE